RVPQADGRPGLAGDRARRRRRGRPPGAGGTRPPGAGRVAAAPGPRAGLVRRGDDVALAGARPPAAGDPPRGLPTARARRADRGGDAEHREPAVLLVRAELVRARPAAAPDAL